MNRDELATLEVQEYAAGKRHAHTCAPNGVVENGRALYADKILLSETPAFHRPGTPLYALPLLASRVVAFTPPLPQQDLERVLGGTPFALFEALVEENILIPVIAAPTEYDQPYCTYLDSVLRHPSTVSLPSRGYGLVAGIGREHLFHEAAADARLAGLTELVHLHDRWISEFPAIATNPQTLRDRVRQELVNNYIDLVIYGSSDARMRISCRLKDGALWDRRYRALILRRPPRTGIDARSLAPLGAVPAIIRLQLGVA